MRQIHSRHSQSSSCLPSLLLLSDSNTIHSGQSLRLV
nr:MAG TPA: hypothetical protein [Caudoviricetes sp.]